MSTFSGRKRSLRGPSPQRRSFCSSLYARSLRCELLEDRRLLAQLTVTTDEDIVDLSDGKTSLREAIFAANIVPGADEIVFDFGHDGPATILLTQGELQITDSLTITGPGAELLTIDAQQRSRIFHVMPGTAQSIHDLTVSGMTLTGGEGAAGSAILFESIRDLVVDDCVVVGNVVAGGTGVPFGGAIGATGNVRLTDSTVARNTGIGVQVLNAGLTVLRSYISENEGLGLLSFGPDGGPIYVTETMVNGNRQGGISAWFGPVNVTDSLVSNNGDPSVNVNTISGVSSGGDLTVLRSNVSGNYANGGGGLWGGGNIVVTDSYITGNHNKSSDIQSGGGGIFQPQSFGSTRTMTITNTVVSGNTSQGDGGGIFANGLTLIVDSVIGGNHATARGGGIFATDGSSVTIVGSTIDGNSAGGFRQAGAGIFAVGDVTVENSTISNNNRDYATQATFGGIVGRNVVLKQATISGNGGGGVSGSSVIANHSTVTANTGAGVSADNVSLSHTIVAGNIFSSAFERDIIFASLTATYSLISAGAEFLGPLVDNGGPTKTHALLPSNPAINAGDPNAKPGKDGFPEFDQRGAPFARFGNGLYPDIGAFETQPAGGALFGDFDGDGDADGRDFLIWQRGYGQTFADPYFHGDATRDGDIDGNDLAVWQETYGEGIAESAELSPLRTASSLSGSLVVSPRETASGDDPAFEERNVEPIDRALEQWTPPRRASLDFGDIVTHRQVRRRDLPSVPTLN